jgi:membrane dipeptidase
VREVRWVISRREFIGRLGIGAAAAPFAASFESSLRAATATPFPFVDGLTFMGPAGEIAESGLSAFLLDVSRGTSVPTRDGSIKFWRTFDACKQSIADARLLLAPEPFVRQADNKAGQAFRATKGSEIARAHQEGKTAVFFQLQGGGEAVGSELDRIAYFHANGLRVFQITHHNDNPWGGGCIQEQWTGLTKVGHEGMEQLNALGIIPDLAHVSDPTSRDVLKASKRPVIISHGGARALVNSARCAPDDVIKGVADSGGAMGIFMMTCWLTTDPVPTTGSYLRQIRHVINVGGFDAVGIANDYPIGGEANARRLNNDNARAVSNIFGWWDSVAKERVLGFSTRPKHVVIPELNNPRRAHLIHAALEKARFKSTEIEKIMGGNWIRVLKENLG